MIATEQKRKVEAIKNSDMSLTELIENKRKFLRDDFFDKQSESEKLNFVENNGMAHEMVEKRKMFYGTSAFFLVIFSMIGFCHASVNHLTILTAFFLIISMLLVINLPDTINSSNISKFIIKRKWINKKENIEILKDKMFENSVIDEEIMRCFVNTYGEKDLVNLMLDKENVTYKDVKEYIAKEEVLKDKKEILAKAVNCLSSKEIIENNI